MSDIGWISIHRKIARSWIWEAKPFSYGQAWVDILLECNHRDKKILIGKTLVSVSRGQSANSRRTWGKRWGWSKSAVDHFLNLLEFDKMIQAENVHVTTRITVINYDTYQSVTATGHTAEEPREGHGADTNNNDNNENNENNDVLRAHSAFRAISSRKPTQHELMRLTQLVIQYGADDVVIAVQQCGDNGWHSVDSVKKILLGDLKPRSVKKEEKSATPQPQKNVYYCDNCAGAFSAVDGVCPKCGEVGI